MNWRDRLHKLTSWDMVLQIVAVVALVAIAVVAVTLEDCSGATDQLPAESTR